MDLCATVREAVALQQATTTHRLFVEAPERLVGVWDRERLAQVLANLLSNAIKYSASASAVRVVVSPTEHEAVVSVADQGIGLTTDQQARLFQPFARLHPEQAIAGLGVGLYVTQGIVAAHGGSIEVDSAPEQGSTFRIRLPLERPAHTGR
jgi:signal transduction histidine kinase